MVSGPSSHVVQLQNLVELVGALFSVPSLYLSHRSTFEVLKKKKKCHKGCLGLSNNLSTFIKMAFILFYIQHKNKLQIIYIYINNKMWLNITGVPGKENFTPTLLTHLRDFTAKFHN